eukprot:4408581-Prorocentrum_lima.AAC.1
MTSSLVGSEMCIRDSFRIIRNQLALEGGGIGSNRTTALGTPDIGFNPVSYTHLTLPTICSV